ncbi:MAG: MgtC/SapB family protein [Clostridia bacterium]|nr:MgtC/SapB family protein [Clostridia bacterium]
MELLKNILSAFTPEQYFEFFIRLLIACFCGAFIGLERTKRYKEAGIRTHIIVCCGAALAMIVSKYAFFDVNGDADRARIAAQVISGISFLGAGVIFKNGNTIKGLTTAAGIRATAGIGLAIGSGMYIVGFIATVIIFILQVLMHKFRFGADSLETCRVRFVALDTKELEDLFYDALDKWEATVSELNVCKLDDGCVKYDVLLKSRKFLTVSDYRDFFKKIDGIKSFTIIPAQ